LDAKIDPITQEIKEKTDQAGKLKISIGPVKHESRWTWEGSWNDGYEDLGGQGWKK